MKRDEKSGIVVTNHKRTFNLCNSAWFALREGDLDGYTCRVLLQSTLHSCQLKPSRESQPRVEIVTY